MAALDDAQAWAQANPTDPRAQQVQAKVWASQNPKDPRAAQILTKLGTPTKADPADQAAQGGAPDAKPVSLVENKSFPASYSPGGTPAQASLDNPEATKTFAKAGIGMALGGAGAALGEGAGAIANGAINAGSSGLSKFFSNLIDQKQNPTEGVAGNAALGGGLSLAASGVSAGAGKLADYLAQRSVGMRKYLPGVGNSLVDQGIWGTKNGMANQVAEALPAKEQEVQQAVAGIQGNSDSQPISDAISKLGAKFNLPSTGEVAPGMGGYAQKVHDAADEFKSMGEGGELTPQDLLTVKRQGDWLGYTNSGTPATSLEAEIGQSQANKARGILSDMSNGETARKLSDEQALILAKKALTKPDIIHQGAGSTMFFGKVPGQSLLGSAAAQAAQKGAQPVADALADPRILQSLFGAANATQGGQ